MASPSLDQLLDWCARNGVRIDPRLRLVKDATTHAICVRAAHTEDEEDPAHHGSGPIVPAQSLVVIPKSAVLSPRTCALAAHIPPAPYGHDATLALALALYSEQLLGAASRWAGYLQSLPRARAWDGIALFWGARGPTAGGLGPARHTRLEGNEPEDETEDRDDGADVRADAAEAQRWLAATEAQAHLRLPGPARAPVLVRAQCPRLSAAVRAHGSRSPTRRSVPRCRSVARPLSLLRVASSASPVAGGRCGAQDEIAAFFTDVATPLLAHVGLAPSASAAGFEHAYALVSSRAFMVDAYHGLAMVPIADA
ncbi:hypothetical protein BC834DRAFT_857817 [Gloeopeniophorella convolvens]|nr:hypothetical protein BC834DRAFT_857817 [Gloeopeniophorella convolvens]